MKLRATLLTGLALGAFLASPATAAETRGWYVGLGAGWSDLSPVDFVAGPPAGPATGKVSFGDTAAVDLTMGYKFDLPFRTEFELKYGDYNARQLRPDGGLASTLGGDAAVTTFFANAFYDLPLSRHFGLTVGVGVGAALFDPDITSAALNRLSGSQTVFAWQLIGGGTVALSDRFELQADYRYQSLDDTDHIFGVSPFALRDKDVQSVMFSLRWYLDGPPPRAAAPRPAPPPPPPLAPPPPPPPPVRTFIVFFDFDKSDLTAQAQQVVSTAVTAARTGGAVHVVVSGHTDTVGSEAYNMALSLRRANAVKAQMVADGMADGEIETVGKGFSAPLVPTGPGVREPQNRRAVIDLG